MILRSLARDNTLMLAVGLLSLGVYLTTVCPTVSFIDAGELAATSTILGIPHPTGYPLFTLLGRLMAMVPAGSIEVIGRLNAMSAFWVSCAVAVFFRLMLFIQRPSALFPATKRVSSPPQEILLASAFMSTLIFAFSTTVWSQSVSVEVYSLHVFLLLLAILLFIKGLDETARTGRLSRHLILFGFVLGLSFGNHMTTLLLAPGLVYLYAVTLRFERTSVLTLFSIAPWFLLGLSIYLFLPIRSSGFPPLDWGHPAEFVRFLWHVSGKQYRSWIFSGFDSAEKQLTYFLQNITAEFHWLTMILLFLGATGLLRYQKRLFFFLLWLLVGCVAYSINYDIHDIDSYFLLAYVAGGLIIGFGVLSAWKTITGLVPDRWKNIAWVMILALPIAQLWNNHERVNGSDNFLVEDYTRNVFAGLDSNAVVLTFQWDYFVSSSYYQQQVKKVRPDVVIIDKELLRRSWYFLQLERNHPWLVERSRSKVQAFLVELEKFENGLAYDSRTIEFRFVEMINDFIDRSFELRPVYLGPEIEAQFASAYERVPDGLMLRLRRPGVTRQIQDFDPKIRPTSSQSRLAQGLRTQYAQVLTIRSVWLEKTGENARARESLERALRIEPSYVPARRLWQEFGFH